MIESCQCLIICGNGTSHLYDHFLVLNVAMHILLSESPSEDLYIYADQLLHYFVSRASELYGKEMLVYNVHSLVHITAEARRYGSLNNCSAFPFENCLGQLKKSVGSGKNVIMQVVRRYKEQTASPIEPVPAMTPSVKHPNNNYMLTNGAFCQVLQRNTEGLLCREEWPL